MMRCLCLSVGSVIGVCIVCMEGGDLYEKPGNLMTECTIVEYLTSVWSLPHIHRPSSSYSVPAQEIHCLNQPPSISRILIDNCSQLNGIT